MASAWVDLGNGRKRFIPDVDAHIARHAPVEARSDLAFPMVIRDQIAPTWNPVDGKHYESSTSFQRAVKEAGKRAGKEYEIVGNDKGFTEPKTREVHTAPDLKRDIATAYKQVTRT